MTGSQAGAGRAGWPHVVVVGAGFGGITLARALRNAPVEVTVVDRHNFHTFQPLLYQVATAGLGADDIAHNVRGILQHHPNASFRLGRVVGADLDRRRLLLEGGAELPYDVLVLAAGTTTATFGVPGVEEHAFFLKTLPDALRLRNHVLSLFEQADVDASLVDGGALTFVLAGGGATGVELAGAFHELFRMVLARDFHTLDVSRARVVLVEATDHLLDPFAPGLREHALRTLHDRGVEIVLGRAIERVTAEEVCLAGGEVIPCRTIVWTAGVRAVGLAGALGLPQGGGGRVVVGPDLRVPGRSDVFVIGDLAWCAQPGGAGHPQVAPVAIQAAKHVARQIASGRSRPFRYRDKGTMATIGRNAAVAQLPLGIRFGGFPAWVAWLALHLMTLVGFRNRLNVLVNWAWNYLTWDRGARLIVSAAADPPAGVSTAGD